MSQFTLITGGARSGKSSFAELLAARTALPARTVTYIATARIWDEEMTSRVKKHREQRPATWQLIEEPLKIPETLLLLDDQDTVILLDCVTLWLTNLLLAEEAKAPAKQIQAEETEAKILSLVRETARLAREIRPEVIFVTNEVGQGIVPDNALARTYRDLAGRCNQILAQHADKVYWVLAGLPMEIKHSGEALLSALHKE